MALKGPNPVFWRVCLVRRLDDEHVFLGPLGSSNLGCCGVGHVREMVGSLGNFLGNDARDLLGLEDRARGEIHEWELGLGTAKARHAGPSFRTLSVPQLSLIHI